MRPLALLLFLAAGAGASADDSLARCAAGDLAQCLQAARESTHPARATSLLSWACERKEPEACLELARTLERLAGQLPPHGYPCRVAQWVEGGRDWPGQFTYECAVRLETAEAIGGAFRQACLSGSEEACRALAARMRPALRPRPEPLPVERSRMFESIRRLPAPGAPGGPTALALDGSAGVAWWLNEEEVLALALETGRPIAPARPLRGELTRAHWGVRPQAARVGSDGQLRVLVGLAAGLRLWSPATGDTVRLETGARTACAAALSGDGRRVAIALGKPPPGHGGCAQGTTDTALEVRDTASGQLVWSRPIDLPASSLAVSADGASVAVAEYGPRVLLASRDRARAWRVPKGGVPTSLELDPGGRWMAVLTSAELWLVDRAGSARSLGQRIGAAFAPAGDLLLVVNAGSLELVRLSGGSPVEPPTAFGLPEISRSGSHPARIAFTADGKTALVLVPEQLPALVRLRGAPPLPRPGEALAAAAGTLRPFEEPPPPPAPKASGAGTEVEPTLTERPPVVPVQVSRASLAVRGAKPIQLKLRDAATGREQYGMERGPDAFFPALSSGTYRLSFRADAAPGQPAPPPRYLEVRLGPDEVKAVSSSDFVEPPPVRGRVTRLGTGEPVTGAAIETHCEAPLPGDDPAHLGRVCRAVSGPDGAFQLSGLEPGLHYAVLTGPAVVSRRLLVEVGRAPAPLQVEAWTARTVWLGAAPPAPAAPAAAEPPPDLAWPGLALAEDPGGLRVTAVRGSAAASSIQPGDLVVAVNGKPLSGPGRARLECELDSPRPPKLQLVRGTARLEATLPPRPDLASLALPWWPTP